MRYLPSFFHWLALAALTDWLITRTLTRAFIHMPKSPLMLLVYQGFNLIGQMAATLAALLALVTLGWIVWHEWQTRRAVWLSLVLSGMAALSLMFLVVVPSDWLALGNHLLSLAAVALIMARMHIHSPISNLEEKNPLHLSTLFPALAVLASILYQLGPTLYEALQWPGPPPFTDMLFNLGEFFVVLSPIALWKTYGHGASRRMWLIAALPMLAFIALYLANPAMTAILAVWSTGLTLYLPWPLYAASLWLASVAVGVALRRGDPVGLAILMLAAGGYAPQLSTQLFLVLIALWLLARPMVQSVPAPQTILRGAACQTHGARWLEGGNPG